MELIHILMKALIHLHDTWQTMIYTCTVRYEIGKTAIKFKGSIIVE